MMMNWTDAISDDGRLPLIVRETSPDSQPGWTKVECGKSISGLPDGIHTGGPWLSPDGKEVWKACDGRPFANAEGHYGTNELKALKALSGKSGFFKNWRSEGTQHVIDGRPITRLWIVRKKAYVLGQEWEKSTVTLEQVLKVEQAIRGMNQAWWELGDHISVAIGPDTYEPFILDLSCAMHRPGAVGCYKPDDWWRVSAWLKWLGFDQLVKLRNDGRHIVMPGLIVLKERDWPGKEWVHIYASRNRPMSPTWANIGKAHYVHSNYGDTGVHTWVVTPELIPEDKIYSYELTWAWSPLEMENY